MTQASSRRRLPAGGEPRPSRAAQYLFIVAIVLLLGIAAHGLLIASHKTQYFRAPAGRPISASRSRLPPIREAGRHRGRRADDEARRREGIYRKYWDAQRCDELPAGVDYAVFDYGVNSGIGRSGKVLPRRRPADKRAR